MKLMILAIEKKRVGGICLLVSHSRPLFCCQLQTFCSPVPTSWSAGNCNLLPLPHTCSLYHTPLCLAQNISRESIANRFPHCILFSFFVCFWAVRHDVMRFLQVGQQHDAQELNQVLLDAIGQNLCGTAGESLISQLFHGKLVHEVMFAS